MKWKEKIVPVDVVLEQIRPGMSVFISTGSAEPRTLIKHLMASENPNIQDLELIQIASFADAISKQNLQTPKFRLKTFFSGWVANEAIAAGNVDLIPCEPYLIPELFQKRRIKVDAVFAQITPPDKNGYCSLGVSVDAVRLAMEQASILIGEINHHLPRTIGDTFMQISEFDMLVESDEPPVYFKRKPVEPIFERIAAKIEHLIEDQSCIAFSLGPLFEAVGQKLRDKKQLGIHSPIFGDALMDLIKNGAVTNRYKDFFVGKSIASYACGSMALFDWLDNNPLVEFQPVDKVFDPLRIGRNPNFVAMIPAQKIDITGRITLNTGLGNVATGPVEVHALLNGAKISKGGYTIVGLPSRDNDEKANIVLSVEGLKNRLDFREAIDYVVTEQGVASLNGLTLRERAQALIEIAHCEDRDQLIDAAIKENILYQDQIYLPGSACQYPEHIVRYKKFKGGIEIRFRPIRPSDEEEMRRLFYRFTDESVYYRYFSKLKTMPHSKMQTYVNVDWKKVMSIVGVFGKREQGSIVVEARYVLEDEGQWAEVAFVVDESFQRVGICTYVFNLLVELAKDHGIKGFWADVLRSNVAMMKVFDKSGLQIRKELRSGVIHVTIPFDPK